jgi:hypothetical protein
MPLLPQRRSPQQSEERAQCDPDPTQPPVEQTPLSQVAEPQQSEVRAQCAPVPTQPPVEQTPPPHVADPQQSPERVQCAPTGRHETPSVQILSLLQVMVPQQSEVRSQWLANC